MLVACLAAKLAGVPKVAITSTGRRTSAAAASALGIISLNRTRQSAMAERTADVQAHWTRPGVLARIDAGLAELGQDPQILTPEILATREQAKRIAVTKDSRVLDVGCGIGGPARYLAHTYGCWVDGIDLTPELIETGRVLTQRCKLADRVALCVGNALELPYSEQTFDVVWCQNVAMNIADKAGLFAGVYRVLKPGGLFTSTEYSVGPGGDIIFPVPWAYDASINFLDPEDMMRARYHTAGFRILECMNYSNTVIEHYERMLSAPPKLTSRLIFGDDAPERQRNSQRNLIERRTIYWMITAERPKL